MILISFAEFHVNVLKTDFSMGNKSSFFLFSQIAQVSKSQQSPKMKQGYHFKKIISYRIKSISLSLCVMKLFSSRVFTLTKAAPYPWKKPKKWHENDMIKLIDCLTDRLIINWLVFIVPIIHKHFQNKRKKEIIGLSGQQIKPIKSILNFKILFFFTQKKPHLL